MNRTKQKRRSMSAEPTTAGAMLSSLHGLLAALITLIALTAVFSFVSLRCPDPRVASRFFGYAVLYMASFVGGYTAYKRCGAYPFVCGLIFGILYALINWLFSLLSAPSQISSAMVWVMRVVSVITAVGGAFLGSYKPKKRHGRRHKR